MSRKASQSTVVRRVLHRGKIIPYSELPTARGKNEIDATVAASDDDVADFVATPPGVEPVDAVVVVSTPITDAATAPVDGAPALAEAEGAQQNATDGAAAVEGDAAHNVVVTVEDGAVTDVATVPVVEGAAAGTTEVEPVDGAAETEEAQPVVETPTEEAQPVVGSQPEKVTRRGRGRGRATGRR